MFAKDGNYEKAFKESIMASIQERKDKGCATWDIKEVLGSAYAIKEEVALDEIDDVKSYIHQVLDADMELESGYKVKILKGDIRERKGEAFLIFRYQVLL